MDNKDKKIIKETTKDLLKRMNFNEAVVEINEQKEPAVLIVNIEVEDPSQLIGQGGSNLNDFQRVLRLLVSRKILCSPIFLVDINGYRKKREEFLKELSREIAEQVAETKKSVMLQPMSSYERRIIHLELAERPGITTESVGEEAERRVIIRPYP